MCSTAVGAASIGCASGCLVKLFYIGCDAIMVFNYYVYSDGSKILFANRSIFLAI
jgi:hypothetical protein